MTQGIRKKVPAGKSRAEEDADMWFSLRFLAAVLSAALLMPAVSFAQSSSRDAGSCCPEIAQEQAKYLADNRYNEFAASLNSASDKTKERQLCKDYYKADTRYLQLKHLEETQSWDDYFSNGNNYRQELVDNAQEVIDQSPEADCLKVKSRLLLWQFHQGQMDAFVQQSLDDLMADLEGYAKNNGASSLIRKVADALSVSGEKAKARQAYNLYVQGMAESDPAQLKKLAFGFYQEGNLALAESIYDIYIGKFPRPYSAAFIAELFEIAGLFVCKQEGLYDMPYAEKIYALIEEDGSPDAFDQDKIYLRALNLEKMTAYPDAQKYYLKLIQSYPDNKRFDEAVYKVAMINLYALGDMEQAKKYFGMLAAKNEIDPYVVSSFYQLGLLSQWEGDSPKAGGYYERLIKDAQDKYVSVVSLAKKRLEEIQNNKPLDYNLNTVLDLSLKKEPALIELNKSELKPLSYILKEGQEDTFSSAVNMPQSGCTQVDLQYLWSGNLGNASPLATESSFSASYQDSGTKEINMVIISPAGIVDRSFIMVDVY